MLSVLLVAANTDIWPDKESLKDWLDRERFGAEQPRPRLSSPGSFVGNAVRDVVKLRPAGLL